MRTSLSLAWNGVALVALALTGCTGDIHDAPVTCGGSEALRAAYDAAYAWGEQGAATASCDDERCATPALEGVRANASAESASCVLAGTFEGLRRGCRHGGGHHGGGHHGGGHHGGGHHGGGHHGGGNDGALQECRDDGRFTGEAAAIVFCELSISLGGLGVDERLEPGEQSACSQKFENACTRAFDRAVARYGQLTGDASADCAPFATGEFAEAYEAQRFNQCLFSQAEAEPPVEEDPCANGACECRDAASCTLGCEGEGCELTCERAATCDLSVESGNVTCRDTSSCAVQADDRAEVTCERTAKCEIDCPDCDVQCRDVASCEVHIERGRVRCDRVGQCQVECEGSHRRPKRCRDGSYVCGGSCQ